MGYWFDEKNPKEKHIEPYKPHWTEKNIGYARVEENPKWKMELLNNERVIGDLKGYLITMIMHIRGNKSKTMVVSEEDLVFLYEVLNKEIQLKGVIQK